jgi:predicted nucleotidyltransferase
VSKDFVNLIERLVHAGVDFVIVGGFAGVVHGCCYVTQDIDICCDFSPANLLTLQRAVSDLEPVHRMTPNRKRLELTEETCSHFKNLYLDTKEGQLDCLSVIDGLGDYRHAKQESELVDIEGAKVRVLTLEALIQTKRAMNRPRDTEAISQLEAIKELRRR